MFFMDWIASYKAKQNLSEKIANLNNSYLMTSARFVQPALAKIGKSFSFDQLSTGLIEDAYYRFAYNVYELTDIEQKKVINEIKRRMAEYYRQPYTMLAWRVYFDTSESKIVFEYK